MSEQELPHLKFGLLAMNDIYPQTDRLHRPSGYHQCSHW